MNLMTALTSVPNLMTSSGVMLPPKGELTKEGFDMTFGTNVIGVLHNSAPLQDVGSSLFRSLPSRQAPHPPTIDWKGVFA